MLNEWCASFNELDNQLTSFKGSENNDKLSYSGLTSEHLQRIYAANNLCYAGTVTYDTSAKLLSNVTVDPSFFTQLNILLRSTARAVSRSLDVLICRQKQVAASI